MNRREKSDNINGWLGYFSAYGAAAASGGLSVAADEIWKLRDGGAGADAESGAKIIPKGNATACAKARSSCVGRVRPCKHA